MDCYNQKYVKIIKIIKSKQLEGNVYESHRFGKTTKNVS